MRSHCLRAALLGAQAWLPWCAAATPAPSSGGPQPAQWRTYDLLIHLPDLPKSYSCTELWYKFRDLLLQIGASPYMLIQPYACATPGGPPALSPRVHVKFQLAFPLTAEQARYAELDSVRKVIRLAPGEPASLQAADCALMDQLRSALLDAVPVRVTGASFNCAATPGSFAITLDAAVAFTDSPGSAASPAPH